MIIVEFGCRDVAGSSAHAVMLSSWRLGRCRLTFDLAGQICQVKQETGP